MTRTAFECFYQFQDPLANLKIKVKLRRLASVAAVSLPPLPPLLQPTPDNDVRKDDSLEAASRLQNMQYDEYVFRWQEKVFSRVQPKNYRNPKREITLFSNIANCDTVLKKQYNEAITSHGLLQSRPTKHLFSLIEGDDLSLAAKEAKQSAPLQKSEIADKFSHLRQRRVAPGGHFAMMYQNPVVDCPTNDALKRAHTLPQSVQSMYIMADLNPDANINDSSPASTGDSLVLCTIKLYNEKVLSICPDFSCSDKPYVVEGRAGVFEFSVEHESRMPAPSMDITNLQQALALEDFKPPARLSKFDTSFDVPEEGVLRVSYVGEIESATKFEYDNLYIHYFVELPAGWYSANNKPLFGVTPTCAVKSLVNGDFAYFSCPIEFHLSFNINSFELEHPDILPKWPQLFVEVYSLSSWNVFRTEGFGYVTLPVNTGQLRCCINTWRPYSEDRTSELRRFFLGGAPELEDATFSRVPNGHQGNLLSKYGFRTMSSGNVTVNVHTMFQCRDFMHEDDKHQLRFGSLFGKMGTGLHSSIISVLEAFHKARQRMIAVRDNVLADQGLLTL